MRRGSGAGSHWCPAPFDLQVAQGPLGGSRSRPHIVLTLAGMLRPIFRWIVRSILTDFSSASPVVIDQSRPAPTTSLAKTISVASSVRRQSSRVRCSPRRNASRSSRPLPRQRSSELPKPMARASSSVGEAGPPHSASPRASTYRSSGVRSTGIGPDVFTRPLSPRSGTGAGRFTGGFYGARFPVACAAVEAAPARGP